LPAKSRAPAALQVKGLCAGFDQAASGARRNWRWRICRPDARPFACVGAAAQGASRPTIDADHEVTASRVRAGVWAGRDPGAMTSVLICPSTHGDGPGSDGPAHWCEKPPEGGGGVRGRGSRVTRLRLEIRALAAGGAKGLRKAEKPTRAAASRNGRKEELRAPVIWRTWTRGWNSVRLAHTK